MLGTCTPAGGNACACVHMRVRVYVCVRPCMCHETFFALKYIVRKTGKNPVKNTFACYKGHYWDNMVYEWGC